LIGERVPPGSRATAQFTNRYPAALSAANWERIFIFLTPDNPPVFSLPFRLKCTSAGKRIFPGEGERRWGNAIVFSFGFFDGGRRRRFCRPEFVRTARLDEISLLAV
jgi:hypothetical protein